MVAVIKYFSLKFNNISTDEEAYIWSKRIADFDFDNVAYIIIYANAFI